MTLDTKLRPPDRMEVDDAMTDATDPCPADWDTSGILAANRAFFAEKPVHVYLEETVVPVLQAGLKQLALARPADPCAFLGNFLLQHRLPEERTPEARAEVMMRPPPPLTDQTSVLISSPTPRVSNGVTSASPAASPSASFPETDP
ncbi:hypothetical protein IWQ60_010995 [Tieghemiomyces parasiticus]|uniref:Uncharacterized protein n=1 Tax=Tieghemiomyces parasiticus TaxID=78921 RepID=A0A9W7ZI78_9FUNG|nr:hypothetical protein IWQ60_010995 [Tieghemiomyces parasiticus]